MALTKISTGGVKDDAASQAKIADEAVDEARLQISNAGTNGQFLSKQTGNTGGLTWATVTVPDADKVIEGNTSVEAVDTGSDGHVKITTEGTERVRIANDGKIGIGTQSPVGGDLVVENTTGNAGIALSRVFSGNVSGATNTPSFTFTMSDTATNDQVVASISPQALAGTGDAFKGQLRVFTAAENGTNTERFRVGDSGQLGIGGATYGSSGQVLTSGGSGAAPSWTTISAAPEITATATGSISDQAAVYVKTNGTVEAIASVAPNGSLATLSQSHSIIYDFTYDVLRDRYLVWYYNNSRLKVRVGTSNGTSFSWGAEVQVYGNTATKVEAIYLTGVNRHLVVWQFSSHNVAQMRIVIVNADDSITLGTHRNMGSATMYSASQFGLCQGNADGTKAIFVQQATSSSLRAYTLDISDDGATYNDVNYNSSHGYYQIMSTNIYWPMQSTFDSYNNRAIFSAIRSYDENPLWVASLDTVNRTAPQSGGYSDVTSSSAWAVDRWDLAFNPDTKRLVITYGKNGSGGSKAIKYEIWKYASGGTTLEVAQDTTDIISDGTECFGGEGENLHYDENKKQVYVIYRYNSGGNKVAWREITTTDGSDSGSLGTEVIVNTSITTGDRYFLNRHTDSNKQLMICGDDSSNIKALNCVFESTNFTGPDFIGFANGAVSNGQTATINVVGNQVTKSSLTPGSKYYVQLDGSIGTSPVSPSVEAGIALTSTKLLIK